MVEFSYLRIICDFIYDDNVFLRPARATQFFIKRYYSTTSYYLLP